MEEGVNVVAWLRVRIECGFVLLDELDEEAVQLANALRHWLIVEVLQK